MSIRRAPRRGQGFTVIENHIVNDKRIGWAARGLLIYLLSKPDDWKVSVPALINETGEAVAKTGRDGIYSLLRELRDAGYADFEKSHGSDGKISGCDWVIREVPLPAETTPDGPQPNASQPLTAQPDALLNTERTPRTERDQGIPSGSVELPFDAPPRQALSKGVVHELIEIWNRICGHGLGKVQKLHDTRLVALRKRFTEDFAGDRDQWVAFCRRVSRAPWLTGDNDKNWRADFDWCLKPVNFAKIVEGKYDDKSQQRPTYNPHLRPGDPGWRPSPGTI